VSTFAMFVFLVILDDKNTALCSEVHNHAANRAIKHIKNIFRLTFFWVVVNQVFTIVTPLYQIYLNASLY